MSQSGIPSPPEHYTPKQVEEYYYSFFRKTLSVSTTKDESLAQTAKDDQHVVDQPMTTQKETELPGVAQLVSEADLSKRDEVTQDLPPPTQVSAVPSSSKANLPKEHCTPPRT